MFASFERSGNTWLRFVLFEILTNDNAEFLNVNQLLPELGTHRETQAGAAEWRTIHQDPRNRTARNTSGRFTSCATCAT